MHVAMIGPGYVGLVRGACFAGIGHIVTCIDKDAGKIDLLQSGGILIFEPGLDKLIAGGLDQRAAPIELIETTVKVGDARKKAMSRKVVAALDGQDLAGKTVGVLGLTFRPNTDDMRDAPSLDIVPALQAADAKVQAFDPEGHKPRAMLPVVGFKDDPYAVAQGADALVIITERDQFRALDLDRVKLLMNRPVLVDLRNIYKPEEARREGFKYTSVGRI